MYCTKNIKQLLKKHYKENIIICSKSPRKDDLISFEDMAANLIKVNYKDTNNFINDKCTRTIFTA